jgi:hypothetical protein
MRASKQFFVENGLAELGLTAAVYDMEPEDLERISGRLDAYLAELEAKGARVPGWVYASEPGVANLAVVVNVPMHLVNMIVLSAAIIAAPSIGKNLSSITVAQLKMARDAMLFAGKTIPQMQPQHEYASWVRESNHGRWRQFYRRKPPRLDAGPDSAFSPDMGLWNGDDTINGF